MRKVIFLVVEKSLFIYKKTETNTLSWNVFLVIDKVKFSMAKL